MAQLSSAVEFVRKARHTSFEIAKETYSCHMLRYNNTLKLLIACKLGKLELVRSLLGNSPSAADVNGRTPDNKDTPLTACIKFDQKEVFDHLIAHPDMLVDTTVNLFYGPCQRSTALLISAEKNAIKMLVSLLRYGANRFE